MVETGSLPAVEDYGLGLIPWSPLAGGLLGGVLQEDRTGSPASEGMQKSPREVPPADRALRSFCAEMGEQPADVALAWLLAQPAVTAPIIGPRTMEQFKAVCGRWKSS